MQTLGVDYSKFIPEIEERGILNILSEQGKIAYISAQWQYKKASEEEYGWKDAGMISLAYFRIIEMEFNNKIVKPLLSILPADTIECHFTKYKSTIRENKKDYSNKWSKVIKGLKDISDNTKNIDGLMFGPLENFIRNVGSLYDKNDPVAKNIFDSLANILSDRGIDKMTDGTLEEIISKDNRDRYRNPPAHTKYLSYAKALECREFVNNKLVLLSECIKCH